MSEQPKRLFIEDEDREKTKHEYLSACRKVRNIMGYSSTPNEVFDTAIFEALENQMDVWGLILTHDHIFCSTSLIPLMGFGSSYGSGMLFNSMMYKAIEENVTGKTIYMLNDYDGIEWDELRAELVAKAFVGNDLYCMNDDHTAFIKVDIEQLVNEIS